jgi:hypothetical protein
LKLLCSACEPGFQLVEETHLSQLYWPHPEA